MITKIYINNCFAFNEPIILDLQADMRYKKFGSNITKVDKYNILKSCIIFGQNNSGKSCFMRCIKSLKNILDNKDPHLTPNIFTNNPVCELGIEFLIDQLLYKFYIKYDVSKEEFIYEKFSQIDTDEHSNTKETIFLCKDARNSTNNTPKDNELYKALAILGNNNLVIYQLDNEKFNLLKKIKHIIKTLSSSIEVVSLYNIPMTKTLDILKNKNNQREKIVNLIKDADLYLNDYYYQDIKNITVKKDNELMNAEEKVLNIPENIQDKLCLTSVYKNIPVPSFLFDSTGTKRIAALSSYIIEALENGKSLFIDELDCGIHFKLTRAIVAMFNNELNQKAQLISAVHDIDLLDCKKLLRKEQIWFTHKDDYRVYLYSLTQFTARQGTRSSSNLIEQYKEGLFGAMPEPELINTLIKATEPKNNI